MNLGKINNLIRRLYEADARVTSKSKESSLDVFIEKINRKIAHLLGKHTKKPENKSTSNKVFIVIIVVVLFLLWESTGFYYLSENQTGIVLTNGKISQIINGMKVGFIWPYPFSDIEIVDTGVTNFIKISKNDTQEDYTTLSQDLLPINISAKFSYQVTNPKLLFLNILQKNDNLDDAVKFVVWQKLHSYVASNSQKDISGKNLTVMSSEVKTNINQSLANLGITLVKLQIDAINYSGDNSSIKTSNKINTIESSAVPIPSIASQLINEANCYNTDKISETQLNIDKFNQLLPQYQKNPDGIAMQMYYDMLEKVPVKRDDNYMLLNAKLSDLLLKNPDKINTVIKPDLAHSVDRNVDRYRDLNGR